MRWSFNAGLVVLWLAAFYGCSTTEVTPLPAPQPSPPPYVQVPHPTGTDLGDLRAIMVSKDAPSPESLKGCDAAFMKLRSLTESEDERRDGARELVHNDPVAYHWCFYWKIIDLDDSLKTMTFIDERQKKVLTTYQFLVPVARGFYSEFHDSRYLRWAILHYKRISEWVFYRKLELTPAETSELVQVANPFGLYRAPVIHNSILEKYGLAKAGGSNPAASSAGAPAEGPVPTAPALSMPAAPN